MDKILLVDVDSKIPNLALMKISSYHKLRGDKVDFIRLNKSGYGNLTKPTLIKNKNYNTTYASIIFTKNKDAIKFENSTNINIGGSGYDLSIQLPEEIDNLSEDYSLYPENNKAYGFITRGCTRKCNFCFVPLKEGDIKFYRHPSQIIKPEFKTTMFLDNNFLAYKEHLKILEYLSNAKKINFNLIKD